MVKMKVYVYKKCSTCRNAIKYLKNKKIDFEEIDLVEKTPSIMELKEMLKHKNGEIKKIFNTSGIQYREQNFKEKMLKYSEKELLEELSNNFKLIKRPFLISDKNKLVGFKLDEWDLEFS